MRIEETITLNVDGKIINIFHDGIKLHKEWSNDSKQALKGWVKNSLSEGLTKNWMPFANFEASVKFDLKE